MKRIYLFLLLGFILISNLNYFACSGVYIADGRVKLFGLNEDFYNYNTIYRTMPGTSTAYGIIGFGHSNSIQAIINEKGLCYDGYGAPDKEVTRNSNLPVNNGSFIFEAMTTCETVQEVVALYDQYYHPWLRTGQIFFADRFGNSVIIEGDEILIKSAAWQICTNFYQSDPAGGIAAGVFPCWRFSLMQSELESTSEYSVDFVKGLLEAVHVENQPCPNGLNSTVYSLIIDQNNNKIYVYNLHDYENAAVLDIEEELNKSAQSKNLSSLFLSAVENNNSNPSGIKLNQNYPNPFNPKTIISYILESQTKDVYNVRLKIYDSLGNVVAVLVNDDRKTGRYSVEWNGEGYASGIYFCELIVDNSHKYLNKMLLIK